MIFNNISLMGINLNEKYGVMKFYFRNSNAKKVEYQAKIQLANINSIFYEIISL